MLIAFFGAFVLPLSSSVTKWIGILALVAYLLVTPILLRLAHRSRTRDAVETTGGTVRRIRKLPFWKQPFSPKDAFFLGLRFEVEYVDLLGTTHRALCNSGFFQGVEWLQDVIVDT